MGHSVKRAAEKGLQNLLCVLVAMDKIIRAQLISSELLNFVLSLSLSLFKLFLFLQAFKEKERKRALVGLRRWWVACC